MRIKPKMKNKRLFRVSVSDLMLLARIDNLGNEINILRKKEQQNSCSHSWFLSSGGYVCGICGKTS